MWYVIQTVSGQEEKLYKEILVKIPKELYQKCIIPKYENIWKSKGNSNVNIDRLFPGYIFIVTDRPKQLYDELKKTISLSILINDSNENEKNFIPMENDEEKFCEDILNEDGVMKISHVWKGSDGHIARAEGPLKNYVKNIVKSDYKNRRTFIELMMFSKMKRIKFCIELDGDIVCRDKTSDEYWNTSRDDNNDNTNRSNRETQINDKGIKVGDYVELSINGYNDVYEVTKVQKNTATVIVHMFGNIVELQISNEDIIK